MRKAIVLYKKEPSAELYQLVDGTFVFRYLDTWFNDERKPAISLTLPKKHQEYKLSSLFPFFFNMLPEGSNKQSVCFQNRIDKQDAFGLLLVTAANDTIGAVTIEKNENSNE
jgi:serine/threonine-protein kinase HipA